MCNHGRFLKGYFKSKDRSSNVRGCKLPEGDINPAGGLSTTPLKFIGKPLDSNWMGLEWSQFKILTLEELGAVKQTCGVYKLLGIATNELLYIGESKNLRSRLNSHRKKDWGQEVMFSYYIMNPETKEYQLKEIENDLIGGYYALTKIVPKFQITNHK
ncbi:hypothetical protein N752_24505 [Desulforamulus aquiferis]|nr:hypothetical protein N752_24505 [Desulforamulus aquiferis]